MVDGIASKFTASKRFQKKLIRGGVQVLDIIGEQIEKKSESESIRILVMGKRLEFRISEVEQNDGQG